MTARSCRRDLYKSFRFVLSVLGNAYNETPMLSYIRNEEQRQGLIVDRYQPHNTRFKLKNSEHFYVSAVCASCDQLRRYKNLELL
jgi:hypothetical protein